MVKLMRFSTAARASLAMTFLLAAMPAASEDGKFSDADLRGSYGWNVEGTAFGTSLNAIRQFTSDGQGNFSGEGIVNFGTGSVPHTFVCSYSIKPNGIGTATCNSPELGAEHFAFVLIGEGNEARFVSTTPGVIIKGNAGKQGISRRNDR
jgi:hypothetical protein